MIGKIRTDILILILFLSIIRLAVTLIWQVIDLIFILTGKFTDQNGHGVTN